MTGIQAVLVAGDRGAAKAVRGRSKGFVELAGKPMVVHVLETLLHTPEVSEIFVVGNAGRLERAIADSGCLALAAARSCPIHVVPQRASLYENVWHTFLRALPTTADEADPEHAILVVPTDIPIVVPEEITEFLHNARASGADYAVGLSPDTALARFAPSDSNPGIEMACFNLAEGRFRQNNLHFVKPLKMGNRTYIQDMYENRYQKRWTSVASLIWRVLRHEFRNLWTLWIFGLLHIAGVLHRRGHVVWSDRFRRYCHLAKVERAMSSLLRTDARCVTTLLGGAAVDIDNDEDLEVAEKMLPRWKESQAKLAQARA